MIINENIIKAEKEEIKENLEESDKNEEEDEEKNENSDNMEGNELDFSPTKYKAKINENDLKKIIDKTFEDINLVKNSLIHPTKPGVISRKVYDIIPNFHDYNVEYFIFQNILKIKSFY